MSYQNLFVFFDIHSKYILPIHKGSDLQTFIHLKGKVWGCGKSRSVEQNADIFFQYNP